MAFDQPPLRRCQSCHCPADRCAGLAVEQFLLDMARKSRPSTPIITNLAVAGCFALTGLLFMITSGTNAWASWGGFGIIMYAFVIALYGTLFLRRLFRRARRRSSQGFPDDGV